MNNFGSNHLLPNNTKKNGRAPIFTVSEKYAKFGTVSGTVKIGVSPIFLIFFGNKWHLPKLYH